MRAFSWHITAAAVGVAAAFAAAAAPALAATAARQSPATAQLNDTLNAVAAASASNAWAVGWY